MWKWLQLDHPAVKSTGREGWDNKVRVEVINGTELQSGVIRAAFSHSVLDLGLFALLKVC